jgi:hypothetical protein
MQACSTKSRNSEQRKESKMSEEKVSVFYDPEGDLEDFKALVEVLVKEGEITREQGEFGTGLFRGDDH